MELKINVDDDLLHRSYQLNGDLFCCLELSQLFRDEKKFPLSDHASILEALMTQKVTLRKFGVNVTASDIVECFPTSSLPLTDGTDFLTKSYIGLRNIHWKRHKIKFEQQDIQKLIEKHLSI